MDIIPKVSDHLARRRAMAEILADVFEIAKAEFGEESARQLVAASVARSAVREGGQFAECTTTHDLVSFAQILPRWSEDNALEIELLASSESVLEFNVSRCRYAEMYEAMGLKSIGDLLSCNRDGTFCQGFNPAIRLRRTQTLMKGALYCDFRFSLDLTDPGSNMGDEPNP